MEMATIYKIYNDNNCYVGSTTQVFQKRISNHISKSNYCKSKYVIEEGNYKVEVICEVPVEDRLKEEQFYIDEFSTLGQKRAYVEPEILKEERIEYNKEYYIEKYEDIRDKQKCLYEKTKDKVKERHSKKIICECGAEHIYNGKARHLKSKKHLKYLENNIS